MQRDENEGCVVAYGHMSRLFDLKTCDNTPVRSLRRSTQLSHSLHCQIAAQFPASESVTNGNESLFHLLCTPQAKFSLEFGNLTLGIESFLASARAILSGARNTPLLYHLPINVDCIRAALG